MAEDLLERIRREVRERKQAARSAYEESQRLEAVLAALDSGQGAAEAPRPTRRRRSAGRRASPTRAPRGENRRRILEVVGERAGVSAGEVAQVTGIARSTVAGTLAKLAGNGEVQRVPRPAGGVGFKLASGAPATQPPAAAPEASDLRDTAPDGREGDDA